MDSTHASLLQRVQNPRDSTAWAEFDSLYRPMLMRLSRARGLEESEADDVIQHCMMAIHRHIGSFEYDPSKGRFRGWLRTLANNRIRNLYRDHHERDAQSAELRAAPDQGPEPDEVFDLIWRQQHLRHALERVRQEVEPATYQAYVRLIIDEQPVPQVCRELGMTPNQVHLIKWRVTARLRDRMKDLVGEEE